MHSVVLTATILAGMAGFAPAQKGVVTATRSEFPQSATLRILVLDGKSGKPVHGREVTIQTPASKLPGKLIVKGRTDNSGAFSYTTKFSSQIAVHVSGRFLCEAMYAGTAVRGLQDILVHGVVEPNSCNPKVSHPQEPGTLTLFVRRESLKEFLDW